MIRRILMNKLVSLGYGAGFIENKLREFNITVDANKYTEPELDQRVEVIYYDKPIPAIQKFYLNLSYDFADRFVLEGKLEMISKFSAVGSQVNFCNYALTDKLCIIGITKDVKIYILVYNPGPDIINRYSGKTYEDIFAEERDSEAEAYLEALTSSGRVPSIKAKDIMYMLVSEYVIDTFFVNNVSPKLKLYDNAANFAELITNYSYKYINRKINRIEIAEKKVEIKYLGVGVKEGKISNDPYLLLDEVNCTADFPVTRPTYAWIINDQYQEELAIYTASETFNKLTYREVLESREDPELKKEIEKLCVKFSTQAGYQISRQYIAGVVKKLNKELIVPPVDFIRMHSLESADFIEPLRYRFNVIRNRREFENLLYNSIENNINGRYKYRFVEKLSGIYLTIGNKLNYTDINGELVRKQSIADFNINFNAAIVKRETIIDVRSIPQLLGYIYNDFEKQGTDLLPVPSIEVVFYFPEVTALGRDAEMYNGTPIDMAKGDGWTSYGEIGQEAYSQVAATRPRDPNEKYVTVKYINSDNEILKENIIRDLTIGSIFTPEIIPIISDKEGKEWQITQNQTPNVQVSMDNSLNIVEVRYVKRIARVRINYINKQGGEVSPPVIQNMQIGEVFDTDNVKKFRDASGSEWNLYQSNPVRFVVSENDDSNVLTLIYDIARADVFISYLTRDGVELRPQDVVGGIANQEFSANVPMELTDSEGCVWEAGNDSKTVIMVSEIEPNNIVIYYDEKKVRVVTQFVDEENNKIKDDAVELIQVGKIFYPKFDKDYTDPYGKKWILADSGQESIRVHASEANNVCVIRYEKVCKTITVSMLNEKGIKLAEDIVEKAQIGTSYTPTASQEIEDSNGLVWVCMEENKSITVSESEIQNKIVYRYKPLMTTLYFQAVDDEGNELLPVKQREVQAGSMVRPDFIQSLTGKDQRGWILSSNNQQEYRASKHEEENHISINYDKRMTNVTISFINVSGEKLRDSVVEEAQFGGEYNSSIYDKITADNGERWMLARTDPEVLYVRENSRFTLVYDEIKARVVIKCVNIADNTSVVDDTMITTKLGGAFVPNIAYSLFDKKKCRWKYVGEPAMSIVAKENDAENIIVLKYEPDLRNVTLKFVNQNGQTVYKDIVRTEQIGSELEISRQEKIIEEDGIGWQLDTISRKTIIVDENEDNNVVVSNYVPLLADVSTRYIDNDGTELATTKTEKAQVGTTFNAVVINRVKDQNGRVWEYSNIPLSPLVVEEGSNKVNIKYVPLMQNVISIFMSDQNTRIANDKIESVQVGTNYTMPEVKRVIDDNGTYWGFQKISRSSLIVSEVEKENQVGYRFIKEVIDIVIKYQNSQGAPLDKDKIIRLPIGSKYTIEPQKTIFDSTKRGYVLADGNTYEVTVSPEKEEDVFIIKYDDYMVNVYDKYINSETGEEIMEPSVSKQQVGSKYMVQVKESIVDEDGRQWVQASRGEGVLFGGSYKVEPIIVQEDETKNVTTVKYSPKLCVATIKYLDPMGNSLKADEQIKLQIGSKFSENIDKTIIDRMGNRWSYNPNSNTDVVISENLADNVIELSYVEFQGTVTVNYLDTIGKQIIPSTTELVQVGNNHTPTFEMIITDKNNCVWEYHERDRETVIVSEEESENIVNIIYEPLEVDVLINYVDLWGNPISEPKIEKAQLGSKYKPKQTKDYTNEESLLYRIKKIEPEEITVKEIPLGQTETPNVFTIVFDPVNSDVIIKYFDLDDNSIRPDEKVHLQVGTKYTPDPVAFIKDSRGKEWELVNAKQEEITVFENPDQNVLIYSYDVAKADVIIRYINLDGMIVKGEDHVPMQVGQEFVPSPEETLFDQEKKKWRLIDVKPVNLKVGSINNIVTVTYQEAKARIVLKYLDEAGNSIKADESTEAQVGIKYSAKVTNKVIYNENEIWRLVKTEPYEIIISENAEENVIKLIYSNAQVEEKVEEPKKFVNPFANTLTDEDLESGIPNATEGGMDSGMLNDSSFSLSDSAIKGTASDGLNFNSGMDLGMNLNANMGAEPQPQPEMTAEVELTDPHLQELARTMRLTNSEKYAINELNRINDQIVDDIRKAKDQYVAGGQVFDYSVVENLIIQEKDTIKASLGNIISQDRSGSKLLKIFEHIVASEADDKVFGKIQQRKAVLITDYFVDKPMDDMDKVIYICERGKNNFELSIINKKLADPKFKNISEAIELKAILCYEKIMLDNYYKARTLTNDSFFIDQSAKDTLGPEVSMMVGNMLVRQATNILSKDVQSIAQKTELEAIVTICTADQIKKIKDNINTFDGKTKRNANQLLKEFGK